MARFLAMTLFLVLVASTSASSSKFLGTDKAIVCPAPLFVPEGQFCVCKDPDNCPSTVETLTPEKAAQLAAEMTANGPYKFRRGAAVLVQAGCRWEEITATVGGGGQMPVIVNGQQMNVTVPVGVRKGEMFKVTGRTLDQEQGWWVPAQPQVVVPPQRLSPLLAVPPPEEVQLLPPVERLA